MRTMRILLTCLAGCAVAGCAAHRECWERPPVAPVDLVEADIYRDGGTAYGLLTDVRGCEYRFCLDGRIGIPADERCAYVNALYPTDESARLLDPSSSLARGIAAALQQWVDDRLPAERQAEMLAGSAVMGMSPDEVRAYRVLSVAAGLRSGRYCGPAPSN